LEGTRCDLEFEPLLDLSQGDTRNNQGAKGIALMKILWYAGLGTKPKAQAFLVAKHGALLKGPCPSPWA
jgi:hypothetical protein